MTENEAMALQVLAAQIFSVPPPDERLILFRKAILLRDYATTRAALEAQAARSKFMSVPEILAAVPDPLATDARERARAERRAESRQWEAQSDPEHRKAIAFCKEQTPADLAQMRTAIEGSYTYLSTRVWHRKDTLDCAMLCRLIWTKFGAREGVGA
jgi:hypothetical protein